jgi:hypothetical protein
MEFQFDLAWREQLEAGGCAPLAETMLSEPVVTIEPAMPEEPATARRLRDGR